MNTLNRKSMLLIVILFAVASLLLSGCETDEDLAAAVTPTEQAQISQVVRADTNGDGVVDTQYIVVGDKIVATSAITMAQVPVVNTPAPPPANLPVLGSGGGEWTPPSKCAWLKANVPQGNDGIALQNHAVNLIKQAMNLAPDAEFPTDRIRVTLYNCGNGELVYDGFIVLGPREGNWYEPVTMQVPSGGAIDSYNDATYTGQTVRMGQNTLRAINGSVTGVSMSYWFWNDAAPPPFDGQVPAAATATPLATNTVPANPTPNATETALARISVVATPTSAPPTIVATATSAPPSQPTVVVTASTPLECVHPEVLATQLGWKNHGWADKEHGGLRVELMKAGTLPAGWEAITDMKTIAATDAERAMNVGYWSIYPPLACRAQFNFK